MPAAMIFQYAPNRKVLDVTSSTTAWRLVADDGTLFATVALLAASGKRAFPAFDPGMFAQWLTMRSTTVTGIADGSAFGIAINWPTAPTDTTASRLISGAGQTLNDPGAIWNVWIRKTVTDDIIQMVIGY